MIHEPSKESPKKEVTIYKYKSVKYGYVDCSFNDFTGDDDYIVIATAEAVFVDAKTPAEIVAAEVESLKKQETAIRAEAHAQVKAIQDKIQSLLSITHQAEA
jgi:hypothetical protein